MKAAFRTLEDLDDRLAELGYSARTMAQIRPEIRRSAKIYKMPLKRIPVDLAAFETVWGSGRISAIAEGFASHAQFLNWRKRVRAALGRASGNGTLRAITMLPEWRTILSFVEENGGVGRRVPPHLNLSIGAVARAASSSSLTPLDLDAAMIRRISDPLKAARLRTFRLGISRINDLIDRRCDLPEIDALLPEVSLPQPPERQAPSSPLRRNGGAPNAKLLWREFDRFVYEKRGVDALGRPVPPEKSKFGATTEQRYADALQQALNILIRYGRLSADASPSLRDICNADTIEAIARFWNVRQIDGEVKQRGTTLYTLACRLSHMAEQCGAKKGARKKLKKLRKCLKEASGEVGRMMPERVQWVKDFAANPALQRAVLGMPEVLMRDADRILRDWDDHKRKKRQKLRMDALKMGTTACMAAILFRAAPMRAANLRHLKFRDADVNLVGDGNGLRVVVPGEEVKNGRNIDQTADDDAWTVIEWYLAGC